MCVSRLCCLPVADKSGNAEQKENLWSRGAEDLQLPVKEVVDKAAAAAIKLAEIRGRLADMEVRSSVSL